MRPRTLSLGLSIRHANRVDVHNLIVKWSAARVRARAVVYRLCDLRRWVSALSDAPTRAAARCSPVRRCAADRTSCPTRTWGKGRLRCQMGGRHRRRVARLSRPLPARRARRRCAAAGLPLVIRRRRTHAALGGPRPHRCTPVLTCSRVGAPDTRGCRSLSVSRRAWAGTASPGRRRPAWPPPWPV